MSSISTAVAELTATLEEGGARLVESVRITGVGCLVRVLQQPQDSVLEVLPGLSTVSRVERVDALVPPEIGVWLEERPYLSPELIGHPEVRWDREDVDPSSVPEWMAALGGPANIGCVKLRWVEFEVRLAQLSDGDGRPALVPTDVLVERIPYCLQVVEQGESALRVVMSGMPEISYRSVKTFIPAVTVMGAWHEELTIVSDDYSSMVPTPPKPPAPSQNAQDADRSWIVGLAILAAIGAGLFFWFASSVGLVPAAAALLAGAFAGFLAWTRFGLWQGILGGVLCALIVSTVLVSAGAGGAYRKCVQELRSSPGISDYDAELMCERQSSTELGTQYLDETTPSVAATSPNIESPSPYTTPDRTPVEPWTVEGSAPPARAEESASPTCAVFDQVHVSYVLTSVDNGVGRRYWPRVTVRNQSDEPVTVAFRGEGEASNPGFPDFPRKMGWGIDDSPVDAEPGETKTVDLGKKYGEVLYVPTGVEITKIKLTADASNDLIDGCEVTVTKR